MGAVLFDELYDVTNKEDAGTWVPITRPDGVPMTCATGEEVDGEPETEPFEMLIAGSHSKFYRDAFAAEKKSRRGKKASDDDETILDSVLRMNAACVLDWRGLRSQGVPVPFTKANLLEMLRDPQLEWIYTQVQKAVHEHARFFVKASGH